MNQSFKLNLKVDAKLGLNAIYAGVHWTKRKKTAEYIHHLVRAALYEQGIPKQPFTKPVEIIFYYNDRLDIDNHGYISKLAIDGMKGWLITDDDRKHVRYLGQGFHTGEGIIIEVSE